MLLGTAAVGKTSTARRLKFNRFDMTHKATIGVELYSITINSGGSHQKIVLWDTDGDFEDRVFQNVHVKGADAAIVIADVTRNSSIDTMVRIGHAFEDRFPAAPVISLVNKIDLKNPSDKLKQHLQHNCAHIGFSSAKTGQGVFEAIEHAARLAS